MKKSFLKNILFGRVVVWSVWIFFFNVYSIAHGIQWLIKLLPFRIQTQNHSVFSSHLPPFWSRAVFSSHKADFCAFRIVSNDDQWNDDISSDA